MCIKLRVDEEKHYLLIIFASRMGPNIYSGTYAMSSFVIKVKSTQDNRAYSQYNRCFSALVPLTFSEYSCLLSHPKIFA